MKRRNRIGLIIAATAIVLAGQGASMALSREHPHSLNVLVLLGEWFGDAYFPLKDEIEARGWTMKRVGVDVEYRGCYNKKRDVVLRSDILIPDMKDFTGYDCLIIPSGPQFRKFNENPAVLQFVRDAHAAGLLVASFCVGNNVVKDAGLIDLPYGPALFPSKVTLVKERLLLGPRGGGPPPGDGFQSAPVKEICEAIARELEKSPARQSKQPEFPLLKGPYLGQTPPGLVPKIFAPGIVSRDGMQEKLNISPDHGEIIFWERTSADNSMRFVRITRTGENWNAPEIIPFSTEYSNMEPTLSPDGLKLFFVSDRPLKKNEEAKKTPDIWFSEKAAGEWSEPRNIGPPVNGDGIEVQPFMSVDHHFYFCLPPGDIYCSKIVDGKMQAPVRLSENINKGRVSSPCLPPDCTHMIFHSNRAGGQGSWDLYISFKDEAGNWTEAKNMEEINTPGDEGGPTISPDGKYLFFSRDGRIHWVSTKIVEAHRPVKTMLEKRSKP